MVSKSIAAMLLASLLMIVPANADGPTDYTDCADLTMSTRDPVGPAVSAATCIANELQECWFAPRTMDARPLPEEIERNLNWVERCIEEDTGATVEFRLVQVTYDGQGWNAHVDVTVNAVQGISVGGTIGVDGVHLYEKMGIHGCYAGWTPGHELYHYCVY